MAVQNDKLDRIERKVDEGAQKQAEAVGGLATRVTLLENRPLLEQRVRDLEDAQAGDDGERRYKRFLLPGVFGVLIAASGWVPNLFIHHG